MIAIEQSNTKTYGQNKRIKNQTFRNKSNFDMDLFMQKN